MKIAVISTGESDFSHMLEQYAEVTMIDPEDAEHMAGFDAYAILGGREEEPLRLSVDARLVIEAERRLGKAVFAEWCRSVGYVFGNDITQTVSQRMVYVGEDSEGLCKGDLLDDRANTFLHCYGLGAMAKPILTFGGHITKHDRLDVLPKYRGYDYTLWKDDENTMVCTFRFCNYVRARFAPAKRWDAIAAEIICFLTGKRVDIETTPVVSVNNPAQSPLQTFKAGMAWFDGVGLFLDNGKSGVVEGLTHHILPDGTQARNLQVRNDCSGEVGGACFFDWYLHKNEASYQRFRNLQKFSFEKMYESEEPHRGLLRWTTIEWGVCYQDDVARTMLGTLLSMQLTDDRTYLDRICGALDYMLMTTGTDGLRVSRTDAVYLTPEKIAKFGSTPSDFPCAHHNGYYMAVLLLTYGLTGEKRYFDTALQGIETLMAAFPDTIREHSETQELCRLILPLACLLEITGEEKHREYLYRVLARLEEYRSPFGGYREHDTGYQAKRSRTSGTESSLLADNGDPVADLLYSINWLPLGFAYSYKVTADKHFLTLWRELAAFLSEIQIKSEEQNLNGGWFRGIDLKRREAYGMPHDVGWGPCCVESGWTVGEILMGLGLGMVLGMDRL